MFTCTNSVVNYRSSVVPQSSRTPLTCVCLTTQSCPTLCDPTYHRPPGSSVHGILQARILQWAAMPYSRTSSQPGNRTQVSCTAGRFFTICANRAALYPLNTFPSSPGPGNPSSVLCLYTFDYFRFFR